MENNKSIHSEELTGPAKVLRNRLAELEAIYASIFIGIMLVDRDMRIYKVNPAFEKLTGYASKEILGKTPPYPWWTDDPRSGDTAEKIKKLDADIRGEEKLFQDKAGKEFWVEINTSSIKDDDKIHYSLITWVDITRRKQMEKERDKLQSQFIQAQKMESIGVLAGGVAHDFNNLLTTVIGNSQLALDDMQKDDPLYEDIKEIRKAGERGAVLTRQLMAFSRKEISQPELLDINDVVIDMGKLLRRLIGEDIELRCVPASGLWKVQMDPGHMEQIIMNLVINARDSMSRGGELTIETANVDLDDDYFQDRGVNAFPGPYIMIAVTDTGIGMDRETMARIFEPFFTTKERGAGTGLGLSMVYGIIKQNNGFIWPDSEPGMGTVMKIYLPRAEGVQADIREKEATGSRGCCGEVLLLVEDDDSLRKLACRILQKTGYEVLTASNGKEALRMSDEFDGSIHLLVTDVVMPGMSGKDLAERLEELRPSLKVLFISGYADNIIADHGILQKGVSFISKPFTSEGLNRKVMEILNKDKLST